jgi:uncharacterized protein YbaR (Trm112 family)
MKGFLKFLAFAALIGAVVYFIIRRYREDSVFDVAPSTSRAAGDGMGTGQRRSISPELLEILADPADKGPVELLTDAEGKEWLINRRNGYRYPVEDGIPIMLIEEGEKHKDESLIAS